MKKELLWLLGALLPWSFNAAAAGGGAHAAAAGRANGGGRIAIHGPRSSGSTAVVTPGGGVHYNWGWNWDYGRYERALNREYAELIWYDRLDQALQYAAAQKKGILLLLSVPDEPAGIQLENEVFTDPELIGTIQHCVIPVRVYAPDGWQNGTTPEGKRFRELLQRYGVTWVPALLYLNPQGQILARAMGYRGDAQKVIRAIRKTIRQ